MSKPMLSLKQSMHPDRLKHFARLKRLRKHMPATKQEAREACTAAYKEHVIQRLRPGRKPKFNWHYRGEVRG